MVRRMFENLTRPRGGADDGAGALGPRARGIFDRLFGAAREVEPTARREAYSVVLGSGKGGTGKSFLATSLAVLLHRRGLRVTLVDCDFGLACDHLLLGVTPQLTLQHLLSGQATVDEVRIETPCGPWLIPGASGVRQLAAMTDHQLSILARQLGRMAAQEEVLILDAGAGIAPQTVMTMLCADRIVLVAQPEIAALTDVYAVVKCLTQLDKSKRFAVVINRATDDAQGQRAFDKLAEVADRYAGVKLDFLGSITDDAAVMQKRLGQMPLVVTDPHGPTARAVSAVLDRLEQLDGRVSARETAAGGGIEARFRAHRLLVE
jgi:flagellar biosynthesis protein FlhG